jgi:hypothetical protein
LNLSSESLSAAAACLYSWSTCKERHIQGNHWWPVLWLIVPGKLSTCQHWNAR